jgi:alpha-aminoadipic semialdehyde synthase
MEKCIGIRREDKNQWEKRVPLTPEQVAGLVHQEIKVVIQPSSIRVFSNDEYAKAGAVIREDLSQCKVLFAVKEIPSRLYVPHHTYICFTHMIKGQPYSMPSLKDAIDRQVTIIDYEKVTDTQNRRLVFFGRFAGHAGMIDSLWSLGKRLDVEGITNPFSPLKQAYTYNDLNDAGAAIRSLGETIRRDGLPQEIVPLVIGFAGYGNVSKGAQELFDLLPHEEIAPENLAARVDSGKNNTHSILKVVFREEHTVQRKYPAQGFDLQEYFTKPQNYESIFHRYIPYLTMLINAIFWTPGQPRLITLGMVHRMYSCGLKPKLKIIGDISCDINGGIECTVTGTDIGNPVFVYDVGKKAAVSGLAGNGPVIMAVDNLPCELPRESSTAFGAALIPFIPVIVDTNYSVPFDELKLPDAIKKAVLVHNGVLTPNFTHLKDALKRVLGVTL